MTPPSGRLLAPPFRRLLALDDLSAAGPAAAGELGAKAARLAAASRAGLPVLPGWVVPVSEGRAALLAGAAAVRSAGLPAGRRAVLRQPVDAALAEDLRAVVDTLGGRVIVRSSSLLESDPGWSGAFSSVAEVGRDDVVTAVRSCWAAAFAVDPLDRLEACGLPPEALALGLLIQPELRPAAGGIARVAGGEITVEGVAGHPGALLSGWADGAAARTGLRAADYGQVRDGGLVSLLGQDTVLAAAALARRVHEALGDTMIEWAAGDGTIWLLQSLRSGPAGPEEAAPAQHRPAAARWGRPADSGSGGLAFPAAAFPADPTDPVLAAEAAAALRDAGAPGSRLASRQWMPLLAAVAQAQGQHVPGRPAAPGTAAGRLVRCRPHERPDGGGADAILLIDRPLPALAPLLFGARGVIARAGAAGSHLAEVARSLGVPMVIGCRPEAVLGKGLSGQAWIAAIDGGSGDVALLPAS
jgi:phosphohistidine swiveling domain-containing protein